MNKGSGTIITIIVVCIVAAIVIYFFARANNKQENEEQLQNNESEYIFDINEENAIDGEQSGEEKDVKNGIQTSSEQLKDDNVANASVTDGELQKEIANESPTTGPGSVAIVIAIVVAAISAVVIYKKQEGESTL